jgi:hypothetical protein
MEDDHMSFNKTIQTMHNQTKINTWEILQKYKIFPKHKAHTVVPLCRMVPMLVVKHVFKIDILKMEHAFHMGYREGDKVFYLFLTN